MMLRGSLLRRAWSLRRRRRPREPEDPRLQTLFDYAPMGIASLDGQGRFVRVNRALCALMGYSEDEFHAMTFDQITHPEDMAVCHPLFERMQNGELDRFEVEKRYRHKDGRYLWVHVTIAAIRDEQGRLSRTAGMIEDVTERRQAGVLHRELAFIVQSTEDAVVSVDVDTGSTIRCWNAAAERLYGFKADEVLGRSAREYLVPPHRNAEMDALRDRLLSGEKVVRMETELLRKDGTPVDVSLTVSPIRDETGRIVGISGISHDISARKRAEEENVRRSAELEARVAERTAQLAAANRDLETFNYSLAHDLRAPLRAVDGFGRALSETAADRLDPKSREYLDRMRMAASRMSGIVDDMLQLSRMTHSPLQRAPVDLSALAVEIAGALRQAQPSRKVEVRITPGLTTEGDPGLLRSALENLLDNAWKFTGKRADARVEFDSQVVDGEPVYRVRDNGAGFDMAYAGRLFRPFSRLHGRDEFEGTGIGLTIVMRSVERHGGRVWAESVAGQGATFYFTVPQHRPATPAQGAKS